MCAQCTRKGEAMSRFEKWLWDVPNVLVPGVELVHQRDRKKQRVHRRVDDLYGFGGAEKFYDWTDAQGVNHQKNHGDPYPSQSGNGVVLASRVIHAKDLGSLVFLVKEEDD
jgi:hypothetical protein